MSGFFFSVLQFLEFLPEQELAVCSCITFAYMIRKFLNLALPQLKRESYIKKKILEMLDLIRLFWFSSHS